jgi:type IX secretion system PorP/SprF family membrane protein
MKYYKKFILAFSILLIGHGLMGQQEIMYTQYMFNGLAINPAYAGSHGAVTTTFLAREQWVGLDGAPASQTFSIHSPINNSESANVGAILTHDKIGVTEASTAFGVYAYRIKLKDDAQLSFGLQAGLATYKTELTLISSTDPSYAQDTNETRFNFGMGVYYNTARFYAGLSIPHMIRSTLYQNQDDPEAGLRRHLFVATGYIFDLSPNLKFKPNLLLKYVDNAPLSIDLNANFLLKDIIWLGLSYRSFDSFDFIGSIQLTDQLQFGYSYDFPTSEYVSRLNSGSHEIMLQYKFVFSKKKVISPRYF